MIRWSDGWIFRPHVRLPRPLAGEGMIGWSDGWIFRPHVRLPRPLAGEGWGEGWDEGKSESQRLRLFILFHQHQSSA